jgi:potassium/hydrogen antiporter
MRELSDIAFVLLGAGGLLAISALGTRVVRATTVPVVLMFMAVGMVAGSEGLGGIHFDDHRTGFWIGTIALVVILFGGALSTDARAARHHVWPALVLATIGVALTAALVALPAVAFGVDWEVALLLGAVVSSTDAAAVFSVLRTSGVKLSQRVGMTLELESGMNDPMAVILTIFMTGLVIGGGVGPWSLAWQVPLQIAVGIGVGIAVGALARWALEHAPPFAGGLFPVMTVAFAFVAFGGATALRGSGFLAVYVAGIYLSGSRLPYRSGLNRVHDFLGWLAQVVMFLILGLLVFPSHLIDVAVPGLVIAVFLAVVARPVVVMACLLPFRYSLRECLYIGWVGLRGAVPIVLATFPVLSGVAAGAWIFNVVFFVVVVSVLLQGSTTGWLTRRLGLEEAAPPAPPAAVEITSTAAIDSELLCFYIGPEAAAAGATIAALPFPDDAAVVLVLRSTTLIPARGPTRLEPGDHVYVFCRPQDEPFLSLIFGRKVNAS